MVREKRNNQDQPTKYLATLLSFFFTRKEKAHHSLTGENSPKPKLEPVKISGLRGESVVIDDEVVSISLLSWHISALEIL